MVRVKKFLSCLTLMGVAACVKEPVLPVVPVISYNSVRFQESNDANKPDSLIIEINFQDGDGDLGLRADETGEPYHQANYFFDDNGILLTARSRSNPKYAYLPPYEEPYNCTNYTDPLKTIYFPASQVDNTFNVVETIVSGGVTYKGVQDVIYFEPNPNHYNITVDFLKKGPNNTFTEFDWRSEYCNQSFDGRFPPLQDGNRTLEGKLSYAMTSIGFKAVFGATPLKLRIAIKDRALNESREIETPEFTLDSI